MEKYLLLAKIMTIWDLCFFITHKWLYEKLEFFNLCVKTTIRYNASRQVNFRYHKIKIAVIDFIQDYFIYFKRQ